MKQDAPEQQLELSPAPPANELVQTQPTTPAFAAKQDFEHAQRVAKMLSTSDLVPASYKGNIQNTMIALEMANRVGASPLMVMQNLHIIQGKPSWGSSFIIGAINSCKKFSAMRYDIQGAGETLSCMCWAYDLATGEKLEGVRVTMQMAKEEGWISKSGSKWKTMPELMIRYRAAAFFGRLYAPEIMMGMHTVEEVQDAVVMPNTVTFEDLFALYNEKSDLLTSDEQLHAERILTNKEVNSYTKLFTLLQSK